jgi:nitroreductase
MNWHISGNRSELRQMRIAQIQQGAMLLSNGELASMAIMTRRETAGGIVGSAAAVATGAGEAAQEDHISLPAPHRQGGLPLLSALNLRRSTREYATRSLPLQTLSDLLWAAFGVTVPYWRHVMVIDIYVARADGVWLYDPKVHELLPYMSGDIRAQTGTQDFVGVAPLNLIYVAHGEHMPELKPEERRLYCSVDTGFIGQNVYLFCASEGLVTVFRGAVDYAKLAAILKLPDQQFVTFAQTVGYART